MSNELTISDSSLLKKGEETRGKIRSETSQLIFTNNTLTEVATKLSESTNYFWTYKGDMSKRYYYEIETSSLENILSSLDCHGLCVKEIQTEIEVITIE